MNCVLLNLQITICVTKLRLKICICVFDIDVEPTLHGLKNNALSHSSTGKTGDVHRATGQVTALRSKYYKETEELQGQVRHLQQQIRDMNVSTTCHHWTVQC